MIFIALISASYCVNSAEAIPHTETSTPTAILIEEPSGNETGFFADANLSGGVYYWGRHRERKDVATGDFEDNLTHTTANANLDFTSGYFADMIGFDLAAFAAWEFSDAGPAFPNEIGLSEAETRWDEK